MSPRVISQPQPGYYQLRLVKGGPFVPARIFQPCPFVLPDPDFYADPNGCVHPDDWLTPRSDRSPHPLEAEIDGAAASLERVWISGRAISHAEWRFLTAAAAWDRQHAPEAPLSNPRKAIDLHALPPIYQLKENTK